MPQPDEHDYYKLGGIQVDVNPYQQNDSDCDLLLNFYSHKYLAKKVRFGYTRFLNNPDASPVRNLNFYQFPGSTGIVRVSGGKTYVSKTNTGSWNLITGLNWSQDIQLGACQISGTSNYLCLSDKLDGFWTYDGTNVVHRNGAFTPSSLFLQSFQSRVFGDINQLSIAESYVGFDQNLPPSASGDPFFYDTSSANPAQGGVNPIDSGNNGAIVGFNSVQNCLMIYKQRGIYRYDGTNFVQMNFANSVIPYTVCNSDYSRMNYFLSYNSIYMTDGSTVVPASFGINTILQDTFTNFGVQNPLSYSFDYLTFFWIGNIYYQPHATVNPITITNAMFVKDERFNEWYIWSIGHTITAFGSYTDSNNVRHLLTGDSNGNTYVWGEQYASDNGNSISYTLRTGYKENGSPSGSKVPQPQITVSTDPSAEANVLIAKNYNGKYTRIGTAVGHFAKFNASGSYPSYKNASLEVSGSTTTVRPEVYGYTIPTDEEERFDQSKTGRQANK